MANDAETVADLEWINEVRDDPLKWFQGWGWWKDEITKESSRGPANIYQRRVMAHIKWCMERDLPCRIAGLKYRRAGSSTVGNGGGLHFCGMQHKWRMAVIGTDYKAATNMLEMVEHFAKHDDFPGWSPNVTKGGEITITAQQWSKEDGNGVLDRSIATRLEYAHGASVELFTAENPESARSAGLNAYLACVPGDTLVIVNDGRMRKIEDVRPGDRVLTDSGAAAIVRGIEGKPNSKGALVRITPWLSQSVSFTWDHKIPTQRGMVQACDVKAGDEVSMPLRDIREGLTPPLVIRATTRKQGGGKPRRTAGMEIPKTRETGFFFGYYLAEGHAKRSAGRFTEVSFTRHRSEARYSDRAVAAVREYCEGVRTLQREGCLTDTVHLNGAGMASIVAEHFGAVDEKHIPDWVFEAGREFCDGLLDGYLSGDGSKTLATSAHGRFNRVVAVTVHGSIATQIRDIAASLGFGWGAMKRKAAGRRHGRNCKETWRTEWNGNSARRLAQLVGGEWVENIRRHSGDVPRWRIAGGKVWMKVRKVDVDESPKVWDLEVDHPDHTFRTAWFAVGNTEVGRWQNGGEKDAGDTLTAMRNALPKTGFHFAMEESTAKGAQGAFYETCRRARWPDYAQWPEQWKVSWPLDEAQFGKDIQFVFIFAAWFEDDRHWDRKLTPAMETFLRENLDEDEKALIARYGQDGPKGQRLGNEVNATVWEQLAWRRGIIATVCTKGGKDEFAVEYPSSPDEAFRASGDPALDREGLMALEAMARDKSERNQPSYGQLTRQDNGKVSWDGCAASQATVIRWEEPIIPVSMHDRGGKYVIGCDPMSGADNVTGNGEKDRHAVFVVRDAYTDHRGEFHFVKIVARIKPPCEWESAVLTRQMYLLSVYYGGATIVVEANIGAAILTSLEENYRANVYYRQQFDHPSQKTIPKLGWMSSEPTKRILLDTLQRYVREQMFEMLCLHAVGEMLTYVIDAKGKASAAGSAHDDDCVGVALALACIAFAHEYPAPQPVRRDDPNAREWR